MRNSGLDELQTEIKVDRRNINILRYADDTTLMAESKEDLRNLLMKVKEESERACLKLRIIKPRSWHPALYFMANRRGKVEAVAGVLFLISKITMDSDCSREIRRRLLLGRKAMTKLDRVLKSRDITL